MIYVLGSINLDMIATGERLPVPGETLIAHDFVTAPGGKGANQALAVARAGSSVKIFGAVGSDDFVNEALSALKEARVGLEGVASAPGSTGIAIILVDDKGENVIVIVPGANGHVNVKIADTMIEQMSGHDILVLPQEIPAEAIRAALQSAKAKGITSILNIAPTIPETKELALLADIIIANETEYAFLTGGTSDLAQMDVQAAKWAKDNQKTLIITLGGEGVVAFTPDNKFTVEALPIVPIDTVGAGDTFCGFLGAGLDQGLDLEAALKRAAIAGSLACLKPGAQPAIPMLNAVLDAQAAQDSAT